MIHSRQRFRQQPLGAALRLDPYLAGQQCLVASPYLSHLRDPALGTRIDAGGSGLAYSLTDRGRAYTFPGGGSDWYSWSSSGGANPAFLFNGTFTEWTIFGIVRSASGAGTTEGIVVSNDTLTKAPFSLCITNYAGGVVAGAALNDGSWHSSGTQATDITGDGKWHVVAGTYKGSQYLRYYLDGQLDTENTTSIPASTDGGNVNGAYIGYRGNDAAQFKGDILLAVVVLKALDPTFITTATNSIEECWTTLFRPRRFARTSFIGGGGGVVPSATNRWFLMQ